MVNPKARAMLSKEGFRAAVEPLSARYRGAPPPFLSLLDKLLRFDPQQRMTCGEALADPAFGDIRDVAAELRAAEPIRGDFDEEPPSPPSTAAAVALPARGESPEEGGAATTGTQATAEAAPGAALGAAGASGPGRGLGDTAAGLVAAATSVALGFGWGKGAGVSTSNSVNGANGGTTNGSNSSSSDSGEDRPTTERGLRQLIGQEVKAFDDEGRQS